MKRKQTAYEKYKAYKLANNILTTVLIGELFLGAHFLAKANIKRDEIIDTSPAYAATLNGELDKALDACKNKECTYKEYLGKVKKLIIKDNDIAKQTEPKKYAEYSNSMKGFAATLGVAGATAIAGMRTDKLKEKEKEEYLAELDME